GTQVRFIYRNTTLYLAVLDSLNRPGLLRDGADRSIEIEHLAVAALSTAKFDDRDGWVEIWRAEREAIDRGDVPYFSVLAGKESLPVALNLTISGWFARSGHAAAVERLTRLDESDRAFQLDLARSSLRSRAAGPRATLAQSDVASS